MFAGEWNVLSRPNNKVVGPNGVLMGTEGGAGIISPTALDGLALWLDAIDQNSLLASDGSVIEDGEAVALWSDKSGNSAENALLLNGISGNYASAPDSAALDITGDIDIRVKCSLVDWTPASFGRFVAKELDNNTLAYAFGISSGSTGIVSFAWSPTGGVGSAVVSNSTASVPFSDGETGWLRCTLDADNGAGGHTVTFYTSTDGSSWTQLGSAVITAGTATLDSNNSNVTLFSRYNGTSGNLTGTIYRAQIYSGIDGTLVFDADFTAQAKLATSFVESSVNAATVTINTTGATGARISGARDLYQGTVANRPVFLKYNGEKYGYIAKTADYFSTPDSAALDVTSDIDLVFEGAAIDWTPSTVSILIDKATTTGNQYSYRFYLDTSGNLNLAWSPDGTLASFVLATSTVATGFTDGNKAYVRAFLDVDDGGVYKVYFYTSSDGSTWSQLGTTIVGGSTTSIFASTTALAVGRRRDTAAQGFFGRVYLAQVWSGNSTAGGTLRAVFNAQDYNLGTTFTSSATGETWTLNGGSHIVQRTGLYFDGSNDYLKSASFSLSQPESVYFIGEQVSWIDNRAIVSGGDAPVGFYQNVITPRIDLFAGNDAAANTGFALSTIGVVTAIINGASSSLRINRALATTGNPGAGNPNGITIGAANNATGWSNIFVSEVLVYAAAHDTATQDRLALYAGRKWGFST